MPLKGVYIFDPAKVFGLLQDDDPIVAVCKISADLQCAIRRIVIGH